MNEILEDIDQGRRFLILELILFVESPVTSHEGRNFIPHRLGPKSTSIELEQGVSNLLPTFFKVKQFYTQAEQMDDRHNNPKRPPPTVGRQGFDS